MSAGRLLAPATIDRLAKLCGLLTSDSVGERASAAAKATELLKSNGWTWRDIIERGCHPPESKDDSPKRHPRRSQWRRLIAFLAEFDEYLTDWESEFVHSLENRATISDKQWNIIVKLVEKFNR